MKLSISGGVSQLNQARYRAAAEAFAREALTSAIQKFLFSMIGQIPQRTGFLAGSFLDVAHYYDTGAIPHRQGTTPNPPEYYYPSKGAGKGGRILKTETSGTPFTSTPEQTLEISGGIYTFQLATDIRYFQRMDYQWNAVAAGRQAFINSLRQSIPKAPKLSSFLEQVRRFFGG